MVAMSQPDQCSCAATAQSSHSCPRSERHLTSGLTPIRRTPASLQVLCFLLAVLSLLLLCVQSCGRVTLFVINNIHHPHAMIANTAVAEKVNNAIAANTSGIIGPLRLRGIRIGVRVGFTQRSFFIISNRACDLRSRRH